MIEKSKLLKTLQKEGYLKIIKDELDVNLEIPHVAYVEIKKREPKVLLFTNPVDRAKGKKYDIPVVMNLFSSHEITEKFLGRPAEEIAQEIEKLLKIKPPSTFFGKIDMIKELFSLKNVFPNRKNRDISETHKEFALDLEELPILKTWSGDGGKFITMGQVYTHSLDGEVSNIGMYRLQVFDKNHLGMHWQVHKDSTLFFNQYRDAKKKMPVTVVIGGDPLYTWVATAPLPHGINEMLLYGFVKKESAKLVKSNSMFVPEDSDIVIEGFVDPENLRVEGPFGDHTGYYTLEDEYPQMEVTSIRVKENPLYYATVVGKPPLEDKYMGWATERVFLPLLKTTAPDLIDYAMPENGVFHNLIIGKMKKRYLGHAQQFMHAFWGVGQMSFVKHAIFVNENAPHLEDYEKLTAHILNRFSYKDIMISSGVIDALDHSSPDHLLGGKLGIDATGDEVKLSKLNIISDDLLLQKIKVGCSSCAVNIVGLKHYFKDTQNPIAFLSVDKRNRSLADKLSIFDSYREHIRILVIVDNSHNSLDNLYMLLWRVANNIDARRDIYINRDFYVVDATNKIEGVDDLNNPWPGDVLCDKDVLDKLQKIGVIDIDERFIEKFQLL
jgi:4-hydroxy-3-polyprenylbenzoate decarboxylase